MSVWSRVGISVVLTLILQLETSAQQNTPQVRNPPRSEQYVPPEISPPQSSQTVVNDPCLHIEEESGELARLKKRALASVKKNGGNKQAFLRHIPDDPRAQCKYYIKVIEGYQ